MNSFTLILILIFPVFSQDSNKTRIPLLREGTKIIESVGKLTKESQLHPTVIEIPRADGKTFDSCIVLPSLRLAEMEAEELEFPNSSFRITGDIYAYENQNYLLVREAVSLSDHADRSHPTFIPQNPNNEVVEKEDFDDSIADIVKELENATGSLVRSIRNASKNPVSESTIREGARISSRRCNLIRNDDGAWIAVFVSDSTGLSDPPCTVLPSSSFYKLTRWASTQNPSTPLLLSGEFLSYHGHGFLLVSAWRPVHHTDHLDN
ncbi:MAG TPA: hypothetical protein EYO40_03565 [Phycisphaerales bacterium]|nr:hypothetical protein [Phycisphaerales bacterium]